MCQLITAATYLLKRNNSAEDAHSIHLNWIKQIERDEVSLSTHPQFKSTLEKFLQSGRRAALFLSNLWQGESITHEGLECKKPPIACRPWKPQNLALPGALVVLYSSFCQHELYTQRANTEINEKTQKTHSPKLEAEITRAIAPIHLSSKKQVLVPTKLHRELKNQEAGKDHPYKRRRKGRVQSFSQFWEGDVRYVGMGEIKSHLMNMKSKWSSSWWSLHTSSCKLEDCSSLEMSIVWKCHPHCRALLGLLETATQLHWFPSLFLCLIFFSFLIF